MLIILYWMELKEENIVSRLDTYICQGSADSHSTTIHALLPKGRLSIGFSNHKSGKGRKVINLKQPKKEQLPVLGHKLVHTQTHRMYESIIIDKNDNEPVFKRVKMSQISNLSQLHRALKKKPSDIYTTQPAINEYKENVIKRRRKQGYEKQKMRLDQNKNRLTQFLSNYQRVDLNTKLKDVMINLKQEVIRANSGKFTLLSKMSQ